MYLIGLKKLFHRCASVLLLAGLLFQFAPLRAASALGRVLYVQSGASGENCTSWADACSDLQTALDKAGFMDQIWVAAGTYLPSSTYNQSAAFRLKQSVYLLGGFAGWETSVDQRDLTANPTILSGDLGGRPGDYSDNSYRVVECFDIDRRYAVASLNGFTITDGANSGMYNFNCDPYVANVTFMNNQAARGGGMYNDNSNPNLASVTFINNTATTYGGGMYNRGSSVDLSSVAFINNQAGNQGGGIYNDTSVVSLVNAAFIGNSAAYSGGGLYNRSSRAGLGNVTFMDNKAGSRGGGIFSDQSDTGLAHVTFTSNEAGNGGGVVNSGASSLSLTNSLVWNNLHGEMINDPGSSAFIHSSLVKGWANDEAQQVWGDRDPLLGPPGDYGGGLLTIPLLPGSAGIDAADASSCTTTDARGVVRPQDTGCDLGAFESRGFAFSNPAGANQRAWTGDTFYSPLGLAVSSPDGEPVDGGLVTFSAPTLGPSTVFAPEARVMIIGGRVSLWVTANKISGRYTVTANAAGSQDAIEFPLENYNLFGEGYQVFLPGLLN